MAEDNGIFPKCPECGEGTLLLSHTKKTFLKNGNALSVSTQYKRGNRQFLKINK